MDKKVIVTHSGMFHADDAFAVATLLRFFDGTMIEPQVIRTRDEAIIKTADFVVDVGGFYDFERNRFDHHQEGGAGERANGIPYAAFGLVWQKFGEKISGSKEAAEAVDMSLVSPVDADDNGVDIYKKTRGDVAPYLIEDYFHNIRPTWQESMDTLDERFLEAVALAGKIIDREMAHAKASLAAADMVLEVYKESSDKRLIVFDTYYPHEKVLSTYKETIYSVFPRPDGSWSVKAVRDDATLFKNRKDLPEEWAGKHDSEFQKITGVVDAIFCHRGRFMAVARSKEGAIQLAKLALQD
jgi:uncharacterized UPF0160 family protein